MEPPEAMPAEVPLNCEVLAAADPKEKSEDPPDDAIVAAVEELLPTGAAVAPNDKIDDPEDAAVSEAPADAPVEEPNWKIDPDDAAEADGAAAPALAADPKENIEPDDAAPPAVPIDPDLSAEGVAPKEKRGLSSPPAFAAVASRVPLEAPLWANNDVVASPIAFSADFTGETPSGTKSRRR